MSIPNKRYLWSFIFNITFLAGYFCRLINFGWLMFILAIPEYMFRSVYYAIGTYILRKNIEKNNKTPIILLQCLYLLTSFFSYDGSDTNSYTFAHLWLNPPETIIMRLWGTLAALTLIALTVFFIQALKQPSSSKINILWLIKYISLGCVVIPGLAILSILLPSLAHTI